LNESDGRSARSERTKREFVEAYIALLRERRAVPTAAQIADRAGYSLRTLYMHFSDIATLSEATCDYAIAQGLSVPVGNMRAADRQTRIRFQVDVRARNSERWLPLWRMLLHYQDSVPGLERRVRIARTLIYERLQLMYDQELATLPEDERRATLLALEAVVDMQSWGHMREAHGLSYEEAAQAWITAIDRLLPPTP
jgi:AcrR family transcriptional regulator